MTDAYAESAREGRADNRSAILAAARAGIAADGVRGMRLEDIAGNAGVSVPLVYYHFESRAGLIRAVMRDLGGNAPSQRLRDRDPASPSFAALREALIGELDEDPAVREDSVVWGEISASAVFDPKLRDELRRTNAEWRALVAEAVADGIEDGSVDPSVEPGPAAELLVALTDGLCTRWLAGTLEVGAARETLERGLDSVLRPRR